MKAFFPHLYVYLLYIQVVYLQFKNLTVKLVIIADPCCLQMKGGARRWLASTGIGSRLVHPRVAPLYLAMRSKSKILQTADFSKLRDIVLLEYNCSKCGSSNFEMLLQSMYVQNLVITKCSNCATKFCLGDQLEWFREIAVKNPQLIQVLIKNGDLIQGSVTLDFESKLNESAENRKILEQADATDYIGFDFQEENKTNKASVNLLRLFDQPELITTPKKEPEPEE